MHSEGIRHLTTEQCLALARAERARYLGELLADFIVGASRALVRVASWVRRTWAQLSKDPDEAYLEKAVDAADLARRIRYLEQRRTGIWADAIGR